MGDLALEIRDLRVSYRNRKGERIQAVRGLSFDVDQGEIVGFLGPNGAGKTSTLKALMGFVSPDAGSCRVFGEEAGTRSANRLIGYLPEVALYYPFMTPLETLTLYGELQGLRGASLRQESISLLEQLGVAHAMKKLNRNLSKGMMQRVGIAQALLGNPKLLVLDEVTSGLDPIGRKELRDLLLERRRQGCTLFFSSHELSEVDALCDRILLIHEGELRETRQIDELRHSLRTFAIRYHGNSSLVDLAAEWIPNEDGSRFASFKEKENLLKAVARVQNDGGHILDLVAQEGSLEEYFVDTIRRAS